MTAQEQHNRSPDVTEMINGVLARNGLTVVPGRPVDMDQAGRTGPAWLEAIEQAASGAGKSLSQVRLVAPEQLEGVNLDDCHDQTKLMVDRIARSVPGAEVHVVDPRHLMRSVLSGEVATTRTSLEETLDADTAKARQGWCVQLAPGFLARETRDSWSLDGADRASGHGVMPILPVGQPTRAAADIANDAVVGRYALRAMQLDAAGADAHADYQNALRADGYAAALSGLRHGADNDGLQALKDARNTQALVRNDPAHATGPHLEAFARMGVEMAQRGVTAETVSPVKLMKRCDAMAQALALEKDDFHDLAIGINRAATGRSTTGPELTNAARDHLGEMMTGYAEARVRSHARQDTSDGWMEAMAAANPKDGDVIAAAGPMVRLDRAVSDLSRAHADALRSRDSDLTPGSVAAVGKICDAVKDLGRNLRTHHPERKDDPKLLRLEQAGAAGRAILENPEKMGSPSRKMHSMGFILKRLKEEAVTAGGLNGVRDHIQSAEKTLGKIGEIQERVTAHSPKRKAAMVK